MRRIVDCYGKFYKKNFIQVLLFSLKCLNVILFALLVLNNIYFRLVLLAFGVWCYLFIFSVFLSRHIPDAADDQTSSLFNDKLNLFPIITKQLDACMLWGMREGEGKYLCFVFLHRGFVILTFKHSLFLLHINTLTQTMQNVKSENELFKNQFIYRMILLSF